MPIDFLLLQINDALFPVGGYAHSWGFETYVQKGLVRDRATADDYVRRELEANFLYNELLPARLAYERAAAGDEAGLAGLDAIVEASRFPMEIREGSRKLASRFLKTVAAFPAAASSGAYAARFYPVAYGSFCARAGMDRGDCLAAFAYGQTAARVNTAVKLVPLSQTDGQRLLRDACSLFEPLLSKLETLAEADLCRSCPGFDLRAAQHETLYSRLYMS
jgi:urease accessory protein